MVSATRVAGLEYRGRNLDRVASDWVSEAETLQSLTPLQLDTFHAWWNLYYPSREKSRLAARDKGARRRPALSTKGGAENILDRHESRRAGRERKGARGAARTGTCVLLALLARPLRRQRLGRAAGIINEEDRRVTARVRP